MPLHYFFLESLFKAVDGLPMAVFSNGFLTDLGNGFWNG